MRCDKCGIRLENGMKFCFECGTAVDEAEKIKSAADSLNAFFENRENEIKEAKAEAFWGTKFEKVMFVFIGFGILAMSFSFIIGNVLSGIVAILMTACALVAYLVGAGVIEVKSRGVKFSAALTAFLLVIPYFCAYNSEVKNFESAQSAVIVDSENVDEQSEEEITDEQAILESEEVTVGKKVEADTVDAVNMVGEKGVVVYITPTGKKYHLNADCAGENAQAKKLGETSSSLTPCKKCAMGK